MLYTAWSNAYSEISLEVTLWPLTSYVEDYKGHSLVQTSFTEPPNSHRGIWSIRNVFLIWLFPLLRLRHTNHRMNNCTVLNTPAVSKNALRNVVWHWCAIHCPRLACPSIERRYLLGTLPDHRLWEQWLVWVQEHTEHASVNWKNLRTRGWERGRIKNVLTVVGFNRWVFRAVLNAMVDWMRLILRDRELQTKGAA